MQLLVGGRRAVQASLASSLRYFSKSGCLGSDPDRNSHVSGHSGPFVHCVGGVPDAVISWISDRALSWFEDGMLREGRNGAVEREPLHVALRPTHRHSYSP